MECPFCKGEQSDVVDSRTTADGIRRRRICKNCKKRFTTYERVGSPGLKVVKRGDRKPEQFSAEKLRAVLVRVTRHRPVRGEALDELVSRLQAELSQARSIESGELARAVIEGLGQIDRISRDRLAANYIDEDGNLRFDARPVREEPDEQLGLPGVNEED